MVWQQAFARRRLALDVSLGHVRDILILLSVGGVAAGVSGGLLSLLLLAAGHLTIDDLMQSTLPLIVGDIIGIAVMTPLMLRMWLRRSDGSPTHS